MPRHRSSVQLENVLCQIYPNHRIHRHGCCPSLSVALNTTTLAHCDAVWGGRQPLHLLWQILLTEVIFRIPESVLRDSWVVGIDEADHVAPGIGLDRGTRSLA